jgi:predicted TIM-barrel fold metal-dependent hydrolase
VIPGLSNELRIIDCHGHLGYFSSTNIIPADADAMVRAMDRAGVERICISSFLGIGPDSNVGNQLVAEALKKHPKRFVGYAVVNPNRPEGLEEELDRCLGTPGIRAIKLHSALHQYPLDGPAYRRVFDYAARRSLPILGHEWTPSPSAPLTIARSSGPGFLEKLSSDYPTIRFIIAHAGFWDGRTEFAYARVLSSRENVFVDLAYSNIFYDALERMVAMVGADKIVFGSDFPLHELTYQLGRVFFAKLSAEDKRLILGGNMLRILGE